MSANGEIYTAGNKFYTAAGTNGMDKFHLWLWPKVNKLKNKKGAQFKSSELYYVFWNLVQKELIS